MCNAITELAKLDFDGKEWICELRNKLCQNGSLLETDIQVAFDKLDSKKIIQEIEVVDVEIVRNSSNKSIYRLYDNLNVGGLYNNK